MLKRIIHPSKALVTFLLILQLRLSKPQEKHLVRLVEAMIVGEGRKTLSALYRIWVDAPDDSAVADFLRQSPWDDQAVEKQLQEFVINDLLSRAEESGVEPVMWVSIDDSTHKKDKATKALETVDWVYDAHAAGTTGNKKKSGKVCKGAVEVSLHVQIGDHGYHFAFRMYLRERTVRRLNRQRSRQQRLKFKSKYRLAREMLEQLRRLLPKGLKVYVLCDSWYTSNKLIKYCRRQNWHVIAAIKSNRKLNGQRLDNWNQSLKHKRYTKVNVAGRPYWVRTLKGRLSELPFEVCVVMSRRHKGASPRYYMCTDLNLSAHQILNGYTKRWPVEVDYYDLKQYLGASDWRVQSVEATRKWMRVAHFALIFLQWQMAQSSRSNMGHVIRKHRATHARDILIAASQLAIQTGNMDAVLERFIAA